MYTILLKNDKSLVSSKKATLYQNDNYANVISFLIPYVLEGSEDINLSQLVPLLCYTDPANIIHQEILVPFVVQRYEEQGFTEYRLPITSDITKMAGDLKISLQFIEPTPVNSEQSVILHTGSIYITISPLSNQYAITDSSSLTNLARAIVDLSNKVDDVSDDVNDMADTIPDDLYKENEHIQLSIKGNPIGEGVNVVEPPEDTDEDIDGVLDLSVLYDDENLSEYEEDDSNNYNYNNNSSSNSQDIAWQFI